MNEAENWMKGSVHMDNLFIVHDYLVLMTAKEKINWIRQNRYLYRWLLPLNGLQDGTPYDNRPVYNIPKFMPLDNLQGNRLRTETYMGFSNGRNTFFSQDY